MSGLNLAIDRFAADLAKGVIRWRWLVIAAVILTTLLVGSGARFLDFATNYRVFFSAQNPELSAFEAFQQTYTKNDNFLFVVQPRGWGGLRSGDCRCGRAGHRGGLADSL